MKISAKSYSIVKDYITILEKSTNEIYPMASLTKLGTALLSYELIPKEEYLLVSKDIIITNSYESKADLKENEEYKVSDLYYGLLLPSGNDVAKLLSRRIEQNNYNFSSASEKWRKSNRINHYFFEEPVGLSSNSKTNTSDLIKILTIIENNSFLFNVLQNKEFTFFSKNNIPIKVLSRTPIHFYKNYHIFGKTGKTKTAGQCFAGYIKKDSEIWKIAILGSSNLESDLINIVDYLSSGIHSEKK